MVFRKIQWFLEKIMWKKFTKKMKTETKKKGIYNLKHGGYEYPITYQLIKDGKKNKILHKKCIHTGHDGGFIGRKQP